MVNTETAAAPVPRETKSAVPRAIARMVLALLMMLGMLGGAGMVFLGMVPEPAYDLAERIYFSLLPIFAMVLGYYFGSSQGSDDKNTIIETALKNGSKPT